MINWTRYCVLSYLNGHRLLHVRESFTASSPVLPLNAQEPTSSGSFESRSNILIHETVRVRDSIPILPVVNDGLHQESLLTIEITLCPHVFSDRSNSLCSERVEVLLLYYMLTCKVLGKRPLPSSLTVSEENLYTLV
jgi:hypothetical protein